MKLLYDKDVDCLYIELRDTKAHHNVDVTPGVSIDVDEGGKIVGIEIIDASEILKDNLYDLEFHQVPVRQVG